MGTLNELRGNLGRAFDTLAEGWQQLRGRAAQALTRFVPNRPGGDVQTLNDRVALQGVRWGLVAAEVQETTGQVLVRLELPGMERDDFEVFVVDETLVVRGEKRVERERQDGHYHIMERAYGRFERAIPLPAPVEPSAARARYRRGILEVSLDKSLQGNGPRRIEVKSS